MTYANPTTANRIAAVLLPLAIAAMATFAFAPLRHADFLNWDDHKLLLTNASYRGLSPASLRWMFTTTHLGQYQPLAWLSYALDFALGDGSPRPFHRTNITLHVLSAILAFYLARRFLVLIAATPHSSDLRLNLAATAAALFFALHPLRVEPVAWLADRGYLLATLFFFIALLAWLSFVRARVAGRRARAAYALACLAALASLLSRPIATPIIVVLLLLDVLPLRRLPLSPRMWLRPSHRAILREKLPFLILSLVGIASSLYAKSAAGAVADVQTFPLASRLAAACYSIAFYLVRTVLPLNLLPFYERPITFAALRVVVAAAAMLLVLITLLVAFDRRRPAGLLLWLYYLVMILPFSGLVTIGPQLVADRYAQLACLGWALFVGVAVHRLLGAPTARTARTAAACTLMLIGVVFFVVLTRRQCAHWQTSETVWTRTLAAQPHSRTAHYNLGCWLRDEGNAIHESAARFPDLELQQLARLFYGRAADHFRAAINTWPADVQSWNELGICLARLGRIPQAEAAFHEALRIDPSDPNASRNLDLLRRATSP